jgi:hypothetical protein
MTMLIGVLPSQSQKLEIACSMLIRLQPVIGRRNAGQERPANQKISANTLPYSGWPT